MEMNYRKLADATFYFHWFWIGLLLIGSILQFFLPFYRTIHLIILTITIIAQVSWHGCPLVTLENALRAKYDPNEKMHGSFLSYYIEKWFGIKIPPAIIAIQLIAIT